MRNGHGPIDTIKWLRSKFGLTLREAKALLDGAENGPTKRLRHLSREFQRISGFDIADDSLAQTFAEVDKRGRRHIQWFRDWVEDAVSEMENKLQQTNTRKG